MKDFLKKYYKSLFATGSILIGSSPAVKSVYDNITELLNNAGLGWGEVIAIVAGAPMGSIIPSVAVAAVLYVAKAADPATQNEKMKEEIMELLEERLKEANIKGGKS